MPNHRIYAMPFASIYPLYIAKAEKKGRTQQEVDEIIGWLTGYTPAGLKDKWSSRLTWRRSLRKRPS